MPDNQTPWHPPAAKSPREAKGVREKHDGADDITKGMSLMELKQLKDSGRLLRQQGQKNPSKVPPPAAKAPAGAEMQRWRPQREVTDPRGPDAFKARRAVQFVSPRPAAPPAPGQRVDGKAPPAKDSNLHKPANARPEPKRLVASNSSPRHREIMKSDKHTYRIYQLLQAPGTHTSGMSLGVFLAEDDEKRVWVVKKLSISTDERRARALAEKQALEQVKKAVCIHENLNRLREAIVQENLLQGVLILEFCTGGSLLDKIDRSIARQSYFDDDFALHVLYGIAKGLTMLHHGIAYPSSSKSQVKGWNTICHLDLKPANILFSSNQVQGKEGAKYPRVVIADFGAAVTKDDILSGRENRAVQNNATPGWLPPEERNFGISDVIGRYGKVTDIWQMGGVIQVMCQFLVQPDQSQEKFPCGRRYSPELNCLVASCMTRDFMKRPTALDLCLEVRRVMEKRGMQV